MHFVSDRRAIEDIATDPRDGIFSDLPVREPGPACAIPCADEEGEGVQFLRRAGAHSPHVVFDGSITGLAS